MYGYSQIAKDNFIQDIYKKISYLEDNQIFYCNHSQFHINNVVKTVNDTSTCLGYSQEIIEDAKIAAVLHDIGCIKGKDNHAERSYEMAKKYLKSNNIKLNNQKMVLDAIKNHSDGFETDNIITLAIIFADKIDLTKNRLNKIGLTMSGVRQMEHIKDVKVRTTGDCLSIQFVVDKKFNKEEFETFYFIPKVFKAVSSFAKKVNLKPVMLLGENEWFCPINF